MYVHIAFYCCCFFFSSRRRHTRWTGDWSSDVCSSDPAAEGRRHEPVAGNRPEVIVGDRLAALPFGDRVALRGVGQEEIGRASCRERVEIADVAVVWIK